ncbi:MAG: chromate transporter [Alsobacter sp.]
MTVLDQPDGRTVGPASLFLAFAGISLVGFGGVLPWVRWMLVEKRGWMTDEELVNALSVSQILPGGNVMNIAVFVGTRFAGLAGAAAALTGLVLLPSIIVIGIGVLAETFAQQPAVQGLFRAVSAAAAGLIIAMGLRMSWRFRTDPRALAAMLVTVIAMAVVKLPLIVILATVLPVSLAAVVLGRRP